MRFADQGGAGSQLLQGQHRFVHIQPDIPSAGGDKRHNRRRMASQANGRVEHDLSRLWIKQAQHGCYQVGRPPRHTRGAPTRKVSECNLY